MTIRQVNSQEVQDRINATLNEIIEAVKGKVHDAVESAVDNALSNINSYDIARDASDELDVEFEVRRELQELLVDNGNTIPLATLTGDLPIEVHVGAYVHKTYEHVDNNFFIDPELKVNNVTNWEDFFYFVASCIRDDVPAVKMMQRLSALRTVVDCIANESHERFGGAQLNGIYKN